MEDKIIKKLDVPTGEIKLKQVGFDVLVFIPSIEEYSSRITCGNAILSDNEEQN